MCLMALAHLWYPNCMKSNLIDHFREQFVCACFVLVLISPVMIGDYSVLAMCHAGHILHHTLIDEM